MMTKQDLPRSIPKIHPLARLFAWLSGTPSGQLSPVAPCKFKTKLIQSVVPIRLRLWDRPHEFSHLCSQLSFPRLAQTCRDGSPALNYATPCMHQHT
jgi:hypothetical protein